MYIIRENIGREIFSIRSLFPKPQNRPKNAWKSLDSEPSNGMFYMPSPEKEG